MAEISVEQGKLLGKVATNLDGETFYSFQGIPYAKPPIGKLRFKAPEPPVPWTGVLDATKEGSECFSRHMILKHLIGSEDCLILNVYTPNLPSSSTANKLKPVMIWIDGGASGSGSSKTDLYGPGHLLTEDVVLVTINYRVGVLGFFTLDDPTLGVTGNAGLKDMVMALRWVRKNIENFCGDPNNVTIFGESAGGSAVYYLVLSPLAKGLFHKAIPIFQSGSVLCPCARGRNISADFAKLLTIEGATEKEIYQRLLAMPVDKLLELSELIPEIAGTYKDLCFSPVIEKPNTPGAFITDDPLKIIKSGNYNQVPFSLGFTTREGMLLELEIFPEKPSMPEEIESSVPSYLLNIKHESEEVQLIAEKIKQFYYGKPGSENDVDFFYVAPEPPVPWTGVLDATKEGSECFSRHMILKHLIGSEDCLILNVYTPNLPSSSTANKLKPVMFWIHGGAFTSGSSKTDLYGPEHLLTEDVVLVTINYRVGVLGFLTLDDPTLGITGNAGLKDMVMALRWVRKNIENFGGDPNNVTIFGESAGGAAVHYLVLSPLAKGLFHKAIAQSGSALCPWARGRNISADFAKLLTIEGATEKEIYQRLLAMPLDKLLELSELIPENAGTYEERCFSPVIEKLNTPGAFITDEPLNIIKSGNYNQVPFLLGFTSREGMLFEVKILPKKPSMPEEFESSVPSYLLNIKHESEEVKLIADKIKQFYYGKPGSENDVDIFYVMHTDNYFLRDIIFSVKHHVATSQNPVYLYQMSLETSINFTKSIAKITAPGVAHGDELSYLFKSSMIKELKPGSIEDVSVRRFVKLWTNFARNGNPNCAEKSDIIDVVWEPVEKTKLKYLDIGDKLSIGVNPGAERVAFWEKIFKVNPLYSN